MKQAEEILRSAATMVGSGKAIDILTGKAEGDKEVAQTFLKKTATVVGTINVINELAQGVTGVQGQTGVQGATGEQGQTGATDPKIIDETGEIGGQGMGKEDGEL